MKNCTEYRPTSVLTVTKILLITIIAIALQATSSPAKDGDVPTYKYNFSGYDAQHLRESRLSFNINPDGTVVGMQVISTVCESDMRLAGGKIYFSGYLTGSYPQVTGTYHGKAHHCGGGSHDISGTIKIGYHPQFGVFSQLFSGAGGEEYYHRNPHKNPFK